MNLLEIQLVYLVFFHCDPMSSWQKGKLEKNHEFIRYILPKGISFARLNQRKVTQIANHINSVARASLNGCTPFKLAQLLIDRKLLELCDLKDIPADQVILKPTLLKALNITFISGIVFSRPVEVTLAKNSQRSFRDVPNPVKNTVFSPYIIVLFCVNIYIL